MNSEMNARLLRGALATVRKALKVRGLNDVDELTLYEPLARVRPESVIIHQDTAVPSEQHSVPTAGASVESERVQDPESTTIEAVPKTQIPPSFPSDQSAEELFAEMPWEPGEEPVSAASLGSDTQTEKKTTSPERQDASDFFSEMPWDGSDMVKGSDGDSSRLNEAERDDTSGAAQDFFANLNWDGARDQASDTPSESTDSVDLEGAQVSVDPERGDMPEHVRRVAELRKNEGVPSATDDALNRSAKKDDAEDQQGESK